MVDLCILTPETAQNMNSAPEKAGCIRTLRTQPASVLPEGKGNYFMERS